VGDAKRRRTTNVTKQKTVKRKVAKRKVAKRKAAATSPLRGLGAALAAVTKWLTAAGVEFAIIGGVAASLRGHPRLTKDVDVVVHAEEGTWEPLMRRGARHGLHPRIDDALPFARITRVLLLVHQPSRIEVDVSLGMLPFELELIARARPLRHGRLVFPLASAEDLVVMKSLALRPRDIADIEGIVASVPDLDIARIRATVALLSAALESDDHLAALNAILRRMGR
jgi:hypothetical protein